MLHCHLANDVHKIVVLVTSAVFLYPLFVVGEPLGTPWVAEPIGIWRQQVRSLAKAQWPLFGLYPDSMVEHDAQVAEQN